MVSSEPPCVAVLFPWTFLRRSLSVHAVCLLITPTCCLVRSFDTIYHSTDFTVTNETQNDVSF